MSHLSSPANTSPLFREESVETLSDDTEYSLFLTEPFETAAVIDNLLLLTTESELRLPDRAKDKGLHETFLLYTRLHTFLTKWGCGPALGTVKDHALLLPEKKDKHVMLAFALGAAWEDKHLCTLALNHSSAVDVVEAEVVKGSVLEPANWPNYVWRACPTNYLAAMVQAWHVSRDSRANLPNDFKTRLGLLESFE